MSDSVVPVNAQLVQTSEDRVRKAIHNFKRLGMKGLDPQWAGGRPQSISNDGVAHVVVTAKTRHNKLGRPFTHLASASSPSTSPTRVPFRSGPWVT